MFDNFIANFVMGKLLAMFSELAINDASTIMVALGKAFGPPDIKHFSELPLSDRIDLARRVPVLNAKHSDWPAPLRWVPRWMTTFVGVPPTKLAGNATSDKPIPDRGSCWIGRGYVALTTESGLHFRFGFRWDDVDKYYNFPAFTLKKV